MHIFVQAHTPKKLAKIFADLSHSPGRLKFCAKPLVSLATLLPVRFMNAVAWIPALNTACESDSEDRRFKERVFAVSTHLLSPLFELLEHRHCFMCLQLLVVVRVLVVVAVKVDVKD